MIDNIPYAGEIFALVTALVWAFAVILFKKSGEKVHPLGLNLFKSGLTLILMVPTIYLFGEKLNYPAPFSDYAMLILSGILGIGLGDTLFFKGLNKLGASLSSIAGCSYSPIIIGLSMIMLGEKFTLLQVVGTTMIISAIIATSGEIRIGTIGRKDLALGVIYSLLANLANGVGIVLIKPILDKSPLLWATEIRLVGGVATIIVIMLLRKNRVAIWDSLTKTNSWGWTISGTMIGTYLAMALWLAGMKFTQASTAAVLNQTSHIWVFLFAALFLKEKMNPMRIFAIALAMTGVFLVATG
jgi:drug/metabolite transporter (DMT)-like permease